MFFCAAIWLKDFKVQNDINKDQRIRIVIASVLKPISDPRMFEKFGLSLAKTNKYVVFLVGYKGKTVANYHNIRFKVLFDFSRLSINRIFAPIKFLRYLLKVKPEIIIVQTYELLFIGCIYKYYGGAKLIYDVQENYYRNIMYSKSYYLFIRFFLALYVRCIEKTSAYYVDHFIAAEKCYTSELTFLPEDKTTVVENKYYFINILKEKDLRTKPDIHAIRCLFSGTISKETGVFDAIKLVSRLHEINKNIYLVLAGHFTNKSDFDKIKRISKQNRYIKILGNMFPMDHQEIINQISKSRFGIISYPINKITRNRIPTKLYEYLANQLPILCTINQAWNEIIAKYDGGIIVDFKNTTVDLILKYIETQKFYTTDLPNSQLLWVNEEVKLLKCVAQQVIGK